MIERVTLDDVTYALPPHRFEAGTPPILEAISLGEAIRWFDRFEIADVAAHEHDLLIHAVQTGLPQMNSIRFHGTSPGKGAVLSFSCRRCPPA